MPSSVLSFSEYRALVEQAPILIWRADLTMGCDYFNDRWLTFTGRTMDEERGNGWAGGVHPEDLDRCLRIYTEAFAARRVFEMEYRLLRHDGIYRWIFDRGVPFADEGGRFAGYIGSCVDVTERVEAHAQLNATREEELKILRELLPMCSWCGKIRDDSGYWSLCERHSIDHSTRRFTHSICPDCQTRYFPDETLLS